MHKPANISAHKPFRLSTRTEGLSNNVSSSERTFLPKKILLEIEKETRAYKKIRVLLW